MELSTSLSLLVEPTDQNFFLGEGHFQSMQQCVNAGYRFFDWNACDYAVEATRPDSTSLIRDDWRDFVKAMRHQADEFNVQFNQAHGLIFNYFGQDECTEFLHRMEDRVMQACAELGVRRIIYHPVVPDGLRESQNAEGCKKANRDYISRVAERAGLLGLEIDIENMFNTRYADGTGFWRYCSYPYELADLVDSIGMDNVKICLDVGHAHLMDEDISNTVAFYGSRLAALHIHDNEGTVDQHVMPFCGTIEWEQLMQALAENNYSGDFTYEIHNTRLRMPQELKTYKLKETVEVGQWLIGRYDHYKDYGKTSKSSAMTGGNNHDVINENK